MTVPTFLIANVTAPVGADVRSSLMAMSVSVTTTGPVAAACVAGAGATVGATVACVTTGAAVAAVRLGAAFVDAEHAAATSAIAMIAANAWKDRGPGCVHMADLRVDRTQGRSRTADGGEPDPDDRLTDQPPRERQITEGFASR